MGDKGKDFTQQIVHALHATGPVKQEVLWMIADELCREISEVKSRLITHKPEFVMEQLHALQNQAYKLRNHLQRAELSPKGGSGNG